MQFTTIITLTCLIATAIASTNNEPAADVAGFHGHLAAYDSIYDAPEVERSPRTKRGLLLLKKKLLLGALGLKAVKVGAVGAGLAGALALKSKSHAPSRNVEVYGWSG